MYKFLLFTDGSANGSNSGGSACIVQDPQTLESYNICCSFGQSTNNQAELFATFLGYSFIRLYVREKQIPIEEVVISLVSDSEYILNGSCNYITSWVKTGKLKSGEIKNANFWEAFLAFSYGYKIIPKHVKGHNGHIENEKCDYASGWCRKNNADIKSGTLIELQYPKKRTDKFKKTEFWFYLNVDEQFSFLRDGGNNQNLLNDIERPLSKIFDVEAVSSYTIERKALDHLRERADALVRLCHKYQKTLNSSEIDELSSKLIVALKEF